MMFPKSYKDIILPNGESLKQRYEAARNIPAFDRIDSNMTAQAQAAENSAAAEVVPAPGADAEQAQAQPVYFYPPTTVKPRFGLVHVFLLVGSIYLLKKIFKG